MKFYLKVRLKLLYVIIDSLYQITGLIYFKEREVLSLSKIDLFKSILNQLIFSKMRPIQNSYVEIKNEAMWLKSW